MRQAIETKGCSMISRYIYSIKLWIRRIRFKLSKQDLDAILTHDPLDILND